VLKGKIADFSEPRWTSQARSAPRHHRAPVWCTGRAHDATTEPPHTANPNHNHNLQTSLTCLCGGCATRSRLARRPPSAQTRRPGIQRSRRPAKVQPTPQALRAWHHGVWHTRTTHPLDPAVCLSAHACTTLAPISACWPGAQRSRRSPLAGLVHNARVALRAWHGPGGSKRYEYSSQVLTPSRWPRPRCASTARRSRGKMGARCLVRRG